MPIKFIIPGPPRTKKTHSRIVNTRTRPRLLPSQQFMEWNAAAQYHLIDVRRDLIPFRDGHHRPIEVPVNCCALFYRDADRGDAVGYYQALADALEEGRIVANDVLIVSWDGSRLLKDAANPRIEVMLTELEPFQSANRSNSKPEAERSANE